MRRITLRSPRRSLLHRSTLSRRSSSIPGPIEARRRSSKRKYAGTALRTVGDGFADTRILSQLKLHEMGSISRLPIEQALKSPRAIEPVQDSFKLPSWLNEALRDTEWSSSTKAVESKRGQSAETSFNALLEACHDLCDIQQLTRRNRISLYNSDASRLAFSRLCTVHKDIVEILEFLTDRSLNPPAAMNLVYLFENLFVILRIRDRTKNWIMNTSNELSCWIQREVALGNLTEREIRDLLRWTTVIAWPYKRSLQILQLKCMHSIAHALLNSSIRPVKDLQHATMRCLVRALASPVNIRNRSFKAENTWRIIKCLAGGSSERLSALASLFEKSFRNQKRTRLCSSRAYRMTQTASRNGFESLFDSFQNSANDGMHQCERSSDNRIRAFQLSSAGNLACSLTHQCSPLKLMAIDELSLSSLPVRLLGAYLSSVDPRQACQILIDLWLLPIATTQRSVYGHRHICQLLKNDRVNAMDLLQHYQSNPFTGLLETSISVPGLPTRRLANNLVAAFCSVSDLEKLEDVLESCTELQIPLSHSILTTAVSALALKKPEAALNLFLSNSQLRLEGCLPLVAAVIASPSISTEVLLPLLSRSLSFSFGPMPCTLPTSKKLAFVHAIVSMLASSGCEDVARLSLIRRLLTMFEPHLDLLNPTWVRTLMQHELVTPDCNLRTS